MLFAYARNHRDIAYIDSQLIGELFLKMSQNTALQMKNMHDGQLLTNAVRDVRVLQALGEVRREAFVPTAFQTTAYVDGEIPLGEGRFMLEPLVFATLLGHAAILPTDNILLIGTGHGYAAAVLAKLGARVTAIECCPRLHAESRTRLQGHKVEMHQGALEAGVPNHTFDVIVIDGGVQILPEALCQQLTPHGRLVTVEVAATRPDASSGLGQYLTIRRENAVFSSRREGNAFVAVLPGFTRQEGFQL